MHVASTLVQGVQLKMQHLQNVTRGATVLKSVEEKLSQGVKFQQLLQSLKTLLKSTTTVNIGGLQVKALFDSGSTKSFIHPSLVEKAV